MNARQHIACLLLGSNISPVENLQRAMVKLREQGDVLAASSVWETIAVGSDGPNFLNAALLYQTESSAHDLKMNVLLPIEISLGRVRTENKNAPRTIDIDIIVYDNQVIDSHIWDRMFVALPISELLPNLRNPQDGRTLGETANELRQSSWAEPYAMAL